MRVQRIEESRIKNRGRDDLLRSFSFKFRPVNVPYPRFCYALSPYPSLSSSSFSSSFSSSAASSSISSSFSLALTLSRDVLFCSSVLLSHRIARSLKSAFLLSRHQHGFSCFLSRNCREKPTPVFTVVVRTISLVNTASIFQPDIKSAIRTRMRCIR